MRLRLTEDAIHGYGTASHFLEKKGTLGGAIFVVFTRAAPASPGSGVAPWNHTETTPGATLTS